MTSTLERKVFIGSSTEARRIADMVSDALTRSNDHLKTYRLEPCVWDTEDWISHYYTLQSLIQFKETYDYSIFIFAADDTVVRGSIPSLRVRDNVLFEFGLFVGQDEGFSKSFIIHSNDPHFVLPSDLRGVSAPPYEHNNDQTILRNHIYGAVNKIIRAIDKFENSRVQRGENAVKASIEALRLRLAALTDESAKARLILDHLKEIIDYKAQVLNQNPSDVLNDILSWANTLLDVVNPAELATLQREPLKKVWVCSPKPIEFNSALKNGLMEEFKDTVTQNLSKGVNYTYFVDSKEIADAAIQMGEQFPGRVDICILESYSLGSSYAIHFFNDKTYSVFLNIVRKGKLELLVKLDDEDGKRIFSILDKEFKKLARTDINGVGWYAKQLC